MAMRGALIALTEPLALRSMRGMGTLDVAEQLEPKPN
jgi:hypothetical protein